MKEPVTVDAYKDRVLFWPIWLALMWPAAFVLVWSGPLGLLDLLGAPVVLSLWMTSAGAAILASLFWLYRGAWRRLLSTMILPATALIAAQNLELTWRTGQEVGQYVHFYFMRPSYLRQISRLSNDRPRFLVFNWGGAFLQSSGVVYDESDEIVSDHPSEAWKGRARRTDAGCLIGYTPIGGHFYFASFC